MTNKQKYINFCKKNNDIPLFSKPWWLDSVTGNSNWDVALVEKGGNIFASMPYIIENKYFFKKIKQPKLTQTLGIYFNYPKNQKYYKKLSFEKEMINKILEQIPTFDIFSQSFHYDYTNLLPFYWKGYDLKVNYTYIIDDITMDDLEKKFETDVRRRRKKAILTGIKVYDSDNIKEFYRLNTLTFKRQNKKVPYSLDIVSKIFENGKKENSVKILFAKDSNEVNIATIFLVYDKKSVYYIMGGIDPTKKDLGGMDILQYESIKFAINQGLTYNFEGSMIESIEKYFRSFGAKQVPYFKVTKINSKIIKFLEIIK